MLDNLIHSGVDGSTVTDINLEEGDRETCLVVELSGSFITQLLVGIEEDDVLGTSFGAGTSHVVSETTSSASEDDGLSVNAHVAHCVRELLISLAGERLDNLAFV
ncbi:hypothetical protein HG530_015303 [Fusarium avenaceum]|nr:hypothetical protein HG530_015303 [Fusarium avenaceum]